MKSILSLLFIIFGYLSFAQTISPVPTGFNVDTAGEILTHQMIGLETEKIYEKLVAIRRDLHSHPELAGKEIQTRKMIISFLLNLGIEVDTAIYGHAVVGILKGAKKGPKIAWRSEMDALPTNFSDVEAFKSKINGVQHGCGHDIHLTIALGMAEILAKYKTTLCGTVYFIFQPEEETFIGAKRLIENGLFAKIHPTEIYGLHVTALPTGQILVKPNEMFAYQKRIRIRLKNEVTKAQAEALSKKIYSTISRSRSAAVKPWDIQHIGDREIGLINPNTVFKDYLIIDEHFNIYSKDDARYMETYFYETNRKNLQNIIPQIEQLIAKENLQRNLLSVSFIQENPTVLNDEKLTKRSLHSLTAIYGANLIAVDYGQVPYFNDDFAFLQQRVPGVLFFLGGSNLKKGIVAMNHAPGFRVDEESIKVGVRSFTSLIVERLKAR